MKDAIGNSPLLLPGKNKLFQSQLQTVDKKLTSGRYTVTAYYRYGEAGPFTTKAVQFSYNNKPNVLVIGAIVSLVLGAILLLIWLKLRPRC